MAPLVGLTAGRLPVGGRHTDMAGGEYATAVRRAGGAPVLIPVHDWGAGGGLERLDALLLTGGGDVDPASYGAVASEYSGGIDPDRDRAEIGLVNEAVDRGMPVLGICRGVQVLNVALGGTLVQHLPEVTSLAHLCVEPRDRLSHRVRVANGSRLGTILDRPELPVNTIHHQAIENVSPDLRPVGWAPDGVIEAVEHPRLPVLGVQWHPESLAADPLHLTLFEWLVDGA